MSTSLRLEVPARASSGELARMLVAAFASTTTDLDQARMAGLRLAVSEACALVIATGEVSAGPVAIDVDADGDRFVVRVSAPSEGPAPAPVFPPEARVLEALVDGVGLEAAGSAVTVRLSVRTHCRPPREP